MMRELAGVLVKDLPRYARRLVRRDSREYLMLCNRDELLERSPDGEGVRCRWQWTSDLHAPQVLPSLGAWLMRRALADHPVRSALSPLPGTPQVSFVIGHRGEERLPHLKAALASIAAQEDARVECIVVQQERECTLAGRLPDWVRLVHSPPAEPSQPFSRAGALNAGAAHASSDVLVLHDNDMLVTADYAARICTKISAGWDVVNLKRFIFYLDNRHTADWLAGTADLRDRPPEAITQNSQGGASVAITRAAFESIGGMDESFLGWGGEDIEFWERASTCRVWAYANLPMIHLWHPHHPGKHDPDNPALKLYRQLAAIDPADRIARLTAARAHVESGQHA